MFPSSILECSRTFLLVFFLICAAGPCRSKEESIHEVVIRDHDHMMSPSPSPLPATTPASQPERLSCDDVSNKCYIENCSVTACVPFLGNEAEASFVVVVNDGESSLQLNIVVHPDPANMALVGLVISGHQVNKIKLTSNMSVDSSIMVKVGNNGDDECTIHLGENPQDSYSYSYVTSMNAAYLFFAASLFLGGSWACCKMRQNLDQVPYQELQMEHQLSDSTSVGTRQGWDQSWDGEWDDDEEKAAGTMRPRNVSEINGCSL